MAKRPPIPAELERQVLIECGHRCAIHTCRQTPVEIAHITPWSRCRKHEFPNLIALCPTCHTRYDRGEIDRKSMFVYNRGAWLQNPRYTDFEKRLFIQMADRHTDEAWVFDQLSILVGAVLTDDLLSDTGETRPGNLPDILRQRRYKLTDGGRRFTEMLADVHTD